MNLISPIGYLCKTLKQNQEAKDIHAPLDEDIILLHALIMRTWLGTGTRWCSYKRHNLSDDRSGLSERIREDMEWIESLPLSSQRACVLGDDLFGRLLQHKLSIM
jgi:hypothetical protein